MSRDEDIAQLVESLGSQVDGLDFLVHGAAFAPREALSAPFLETSREAFRVALDISAYSLVAMSRAWPR